MRRSRWAVLLVCAVVFWAAAPAWGQTQITTGTIQGTVLDPSGAVVPNAGVEARNLDTNIVRSGNSDADGRFTFLALPSGRYTLKVTKTGFATLVQENVNLTVGQTITLSLTMKIAAATETITITETPTVDVVKTEVSNTLNQATVGNTPVLGRKFEDLLTLTPGVSIVQGPDGDSITFNGQRGIFNNISLDGGDYNNGFFGEQVGGQRVPIDLSLEAVKEFQVVAAGANAEFGRTAGGVVNVITKSGTNEFHGSLFHFQRHENLSSETSTGEPLTDFHREQFGGTAGGPIVKDRAFFFFAIERITGNLQRANLSAQLGSTACPVQNPVVPADEALINSNPDCERRALLNFFRTTRNQEEGLPVRRPLWTTSPLIKLDINVTPGNLLTFSYNFNWSKKINETFDVPTYGNSANGIEGNPTKIHVLNFNLYSTLSASTLYEAHFTYSREVRPRAAVSSNVPADTAMGFVNTFRFGHPFFLNPTIDELFWRTQIKDNFSIVRGKHNIKFGGEWIHSVNDQVFRGFFEGRYIFDTTVGFLRYAAPAAPGGFGPSTVACSDGTFVTAPTTCMAPATATGGPLLLYLQGAGRTGPATDAAGASNISNEEFALFVQDQWQIHPRLTLNFGLRWEAQIFPDPVVAPSQTAYGAFLSNPAFPSDGTLHSPKDMFQPRIGLAWRPLDSDKTVLRASWGIFNARQNMLTQVGSITTNGVQQQTIFLNTPIISSGAPGPVWPLVCGQAGAGCTIPSVPPGTFPLFTGVRVFSRDYTNPRVYTSNIAFEHQLAPDWTFYVDFTHTKGVHLTRFLNYGRTGLFAPQLGEIMTASSRGKSLYRGVTFGIRKRFSEHYQLDANYVASWDHDDDSNERDPFTDRSFDINNLQLDYALSDRDIRHKFNFYSYFELPWAIEASVRMQARSAQPISPPCRAAGTCPDRNTLRKDTEYFSFDWTLQRPFKFAERFALIPIVRMYNTFNNKNNVNPLTTPGLFNFDGFLRQGVGDPRQAEFAVRFTW